MHKKLWYALLRYNVKMFVLCAYSCDLSVYLQLFFVLRNLLLAVIYHRSNLFRPLCAHRLVQPEVRSGCKGDLIPHA